MTPEETRALVEAAEMHQPIERSPSCGDPECCTAVTVCQWCDDEWPRLPRRLADALEGTLTVPDGDVRERLVNVLVMTPMADAIFGDLAAISRTADAILAAFPVLSRDIAGEIERLRAENKRLSAAHSDAAWAANMDRQGGA